MPNITVFTIADNFPIKADSEIFITELINFLKVFTTSQPKVKKYILNNFEGYTKLKENISWIAIHESIIPGEIEFSKGGAYTPEDVLDALVHIINDKVNKNNYQKLKGKLGLSEFYLIIYYNEALIYNSPFIGVGQDIYTIVVYLREKLKNGEPFDKIFLFYALEPNMQVFLLWAAIPDGEALTKEV